MILVPALALASRIGLQFVEGWGPALTRRHFESAKHENGHKNRRKSLVLDRRRRVQGRGQRERPSVSSIRDPRNLVFHVLAVMKPCVSVIQNKKLTKNNEVKKTLDMHGMENKIVLRK